MREIKFVNILEVGEELKEKVRQWRNKAEIRKCMLTQHIIAEDEHLKWLEDLKYRNNRKFWVVFLDNTPIGSAYLQNINYRELISEWGFYVGEDAHKGKGLGKSILFKFLEMFFDEIELETLFTKVLSNNIVALNLYNKFRFKEIDRVPFKGEEKVVFLKFSKENWIKFKNELRNECDYKNKK